VVHFGQKIALCEPLVNRLEKRQFGNQISRKKTLKKESKMTKKNTKKNAFTLRISNSEILSIFDELFATKCFESKNVLANQIIAHGIHDFASRYLDKPVAKPAQKTNKDLKQIRATVEDTHVMLMILERMISTLYNVKVLELSGEKVSVEEVINGLLAELPNDYQATKEVIISNRARRVEQDDE